MRRNILESMGGYSSINLTRARAVAGQKASRLTVQLLRDLQAITPEWWELFWRCPDATPFQSPAWLLPWWNFFGQGEPLVVAARREHKLCGLALFYLCRSRDEALQLFFIGKAVSDYLDVLIAPDELRIQVAQHLLACAFEGVGDWHCADLDRLRQSSPLLQVETALGGLNTRDGVCPQLHLRGHRLDDFVTKKSTLINLRNRRRRTQKAGLVEFITADHETLDGLMQDLHGLHSKRWNSRGLKGMFSDDGMTGFLLEAARKLLGAGMLRLHAMRLNGKSIAVALVMHHAHRAHLYNFGFDPAYSAIAPASQLIAFAIEQAAREGALVFDFLQGDEPYKFETWGAEPHYTHRSRYFPRSLKASNALFIRGGNEMARNPIDHKDERSPERKRDLEAKLDELGTDPGQVGLNSAGQDGSLQEVSSVRDATEESPGELAETGQGLEATAVDGIEDAADHPERPVHTHEEYGNPEDVPPQNREDEAA
ncbi:MAG: GNAT family N-acetyltransferase [Acidobacteriaceae bacterium]|nr:GNAT family N-acetyltransferase [Acidobacteriaceae bacterium]